VNGKRKVYIATFGCRTNQVDSGVVRDGLLSNGWEEVDRPGQAHLIVINSCTVTHRSDQQVRQLTRRLHRENPSARIVVTGCYAERDPGALRGIEGVWSVLGNRRKSELPILVEGLWKAGDDTQSDAPGDSSDSRHPGRDLSLRAGALAADRTRPMVKIQDGCDAKCTYCIVPMVRGGSRSVPPDEVFAEVRRWTQAGYPEVVLTGIHIGAYGMHLKPRYSLDRLVERLCSIPELGWIRLSSIEPMRLSMRIVELAAQTSRLAPHFHLCLQSGADDVLQRMLRPYNASRFASMVETIRRLLPDAGIGTDVIVGFPGETERDHRQSMDLVEALPFTYLHVFPYSDRSGTPASAMPDKVKPEVIRRRGRQMLELGRRKAENFRRSFEGRNLEFVTLSRTRRGRREGLSGNYLKVLGPHTLPANRRFLGRVVGGTGDYLLIESVEPS